MYCYEIIITPDAEADLFEIRDYIAYTLLVPDVALNYIRAIRNEIQKLTYMASSISPVEREPWHSRGVRKIIAKNFYIYYRPDDASGKVYILNVNEGSIPYKKAVLEPALEEERRLFYVGMTRAKKKLTLCYVKRQYEKDREPSRFLKEAGV